MNILEQYSLSAGQRISKMHIYEKYYPLTVEKFLVLQPWSKDSKNYSSWNDVMDILTPVLNKNGIKVVQVGAEGEKSIRHCLHTQGTTSWGQLEYIISKSIGFIGTDSIGGHLAGHYDKPRVILISNNFSQCVKPYFGSPEKQIILEPDRTQKNPTFSLNEGNNRQIDEIKPEKIAKAILDLLGLNYAYPYKTLEIGPLYNNTMLEITPTQIVNPQHFNTDKMIVRMDYLFNEHYLAEQLKVCSCVIFTNKEINKDLLKTFGKNRIHQIIYLLETNNSNPEFVKYCQSLGINTQVISFLSDEEITKYKLDYCEFGIIHRKNGNIPDKLKDKKLYFKSGKFILHNNKFYPSFAHLLKDHNIPKIEAIELPIIDDWSFWRDYEHYYFLEI